MSATGEKTKMEVGRLVCVVLKARNLPDKHTFSKQDPYAVIQLSNSSKAQTEPERDGGQHPVWDQQFVLTVYDVEGEKQTLTIQVFAKEPGPHPMLGEGIVQIVPKIAKEWEGNEYDGWVPLGKDGKYRGEVFLEMTYYPRQDILPKKPAKVKPAGAKVQGPKPTGPRILDEQEQEAAKLHPVAFNLQRRQSKLDPKTRLNRPPPRMAPAIEEDGEERRPFGQDRPPSRDPPRDRPPARDSSLQTQGRQPPTSITVNQAPMPIQPWSDQNAVPTSPLAKKSKERPLPLPGEPDAPEVPAFMRPAMGQADKLKQQFGAAPHAPARESVYTGEVPRIDTSNWQQTTVPSQPQPPQQPPVQVQIQSQPPAPQPLSMAGYPPVSFVQDRPVSPIGGPKFYPAATGVYGGALYPAAPIPPVATPSLPIPPQQPPNFYRAPSVPQFPPRQQTPFIQPPPPARPGSVYDGTYVPRAAPAPPKPPTPPPPPPPPAPISPSLSRPAPPPVQVPAPPPPPAPAPAPVPTPVSPPARKHHHHRTRTPSPPSPMSPASSRADSPSPPPRARTPPRSRVRDPSPPRRKAEPEVDPRQARILAEARRQWEQERRDEEMAKKMAEEYDAIEAKEAQKAKEADELSRRTANVMLQDQRKSWADMERERMEADARFARELALQEENEMRR
ncbi:hypothetical protein T439DRAFT_322982 [Meredithblackwellia eburnea MCA 4105]